MATQLEQAVRVNTVHRAAFLRACRLDVEVRKPGNVGIASPGHGMDASMFIASSEAAAPALFARGATVGARIERAIEASVAAAGCNTNLGIVLLIAPLARALEGDAASIEPLRRALDATLRALDLEDTRAAYRAIVRANPGGLGVASQQDVHAAPSVTLLDAMKLAAPRDRIARQYADGYAELFSIGLPAWRRGGDAARATLTTFIDWLASAPDSHIARKYGDEVAHRVTAEAKQWRDQAVVNPSLWSDTALDEWDRSLKSRALNPGTSADLTVATAFVAMVLDANRGSAQGLGGLA